MALTTEQEQALQALADREIARPGIETALVTAQAELDAVLLELNTGREAIQLAANVEANALDATYRAELDAKQTVVDGLKAVLAMDVRA